MLVVYVQSNQGLEVLKLFRCLMGSGLAFDEYTLSGAFNACAIAKQQSAGCQLHGLSI